MVNDRVNIAKRLRKTPEELAKENLYDDASYKIEPLLFEMVYEIVCGSDEGSYDDVFIKAADLIDPTCHNKQIEINKTAPLEFRTYNLICSNCGETFRADLDGINEPMDWAYCPNCGYRIVETSSGKDNNSEQ